MKNFTCLLLLFCAWAGTGCKTDDLPQTARYTFANPFAVPVTMDLYGSKEDYNSNGNKISSHVIGPQAEISLTFPVLESYWIDWYSADYSWNNWPNPRLSLHIQDESPTPRPLLEIALQDDVFTFYSGCRDTSRSIVLPGKDTVSHWEMGITDDTSLHGYYELVFRKGFEGTLILKPLAGATLIQEFTFKTIRHCGNYHFVLELSDKKDGSNAGLVMWDPPGSDRDSLMLIRYPVDIPGGIGYYPLLRQ